METRGMKRLCLEQEKQRAEAARLVTSAVAAIFAPDVLDIIIRRYLTFLDRTQMSLVCTNWRRWSWQHLKTAVLKVGHEVQACVFLQKNCPELELLVCEEGADMFEASLPSSLRHVVIGEGAFNQLSEFPPYLESLHVYSNPNGAFCCKSLLTDDEGIIRYLPTTITSLTLFPYSGPLDSFRTFERLTTLRIGQSCLVDDYGSADILSVLPETIRTLHLSPWWSTINLKCLPRLLERLIVTGADDYIHMQDTYLENSFRSPLKEICFKWCHFKENLFGWLESLEVLCLDRCNIVCDDPLSTVSPVLQLPPKLRTLELQNCSFEISQRYPATLTAMLLNDVEPLVSYPAALTRLELWNIVDDAKLEREIYSSSGSGNDSDSEEPQLLQLPPKLKKLVMMNCIPSVSSWRIPPSVMEVQCDSLNRTSEVYDFLSRVPQLVSIHLVVNKSYIVPLHFGNLPTAWPRSLQRICCSNLDVENAFSDELLDTKPLERCAIYALPEIHYVQSRNRVAQYPETSHFSFVQDRGIENAVAKLILFGRPEQASQTKRMPNRPLIFDSFENFM